MLQVFTFSRELIEIAETLQLRIVQNAIHVQMDFRLKRCTGASRVLKTKLQTGMKKIVLNILKK